MIRSTSVESSENLSLFRSIQTCQKHGVPIVHEARQVSPEDFYNFTHILAADKSNLANLERMKPNNATATVRLWGSYDDGNSINDPYYGGIVRS